MNKSSKRVLSRVLSFVMLVSAMFTNLVVVNADSALTDDGNVVSGSAVTLAADAAGPISVWDFGGVEESDTSLYTNYISRDFLDNFTVVGTDGKFIAAGDYDLGGGLIVNSSANDRLYYDGLRNAGTSAKATVAFSDGYTANGMWYANGTGGDTRRYFLFDNLQAGTEIKVYTGCSNAVDDMVEFTAVNGTQADEVILSQGESGIVKFIAKEDGSYKVWFSAAGGKPVVNRIVKTPPVAVSLSVNSNEYDIQGCDAVLTNDTTGDQVETTVAGTAYLTPGYTYSATAKGITGYGFTNQSKRFTVTTDDLLAGSKAVAFDIETKSTYKATGTVTGFASDYDVSKLVVTLVPEAESMADTVVATLNADLTFEATLEPDIDYTVSLAGVNDYEVAEGGVFNSSSADVNQDINVALKATYTVTGNITGGALVSEIAFVNVEDGYSYGGTVDGDTYTVLLRTGSYEVKAVADGYSTSAHVVVADKNVNKDILFVPVTPTPPTVDTSVRDIYVGCEGQVNNFATMTEALEAAKVLNPQSEAERVTIHIAPGTYREQLSVETPYLTFVPEGNGQVVLSWYYGIGYRYYSVDSTGYYNIENAADQYSRDTEAAKWGVGTYVKKTATGFKAENITFEASFNKYITDEEIADGVSPTGTLPVRNYALDVTSKAATERSTALIVEADQSEFKNCTMIGSQDTLYMGDGTHTYYKNCTIEGNTDYIFGSGNAVFDGCELRFCGYSDTGAGGYITAGRSNNVDGYMGYLFRACTITNKEGMVHAAGYFGRPWDAGSDITFLNTTLENADAIAAVGWTSMSGINPEQANFKEYGTTLADGTPVDTTGRTEGTVLTDTEAQAIDAKAYLGWDATYYVEDTLPVEFTEDPYFSTDGDVALPQTGDTFTVKYSLGANDANDASKITYYLVKDGAETVIKSTTAAANSGVKLTADMIGSTLKATVTPCTILGNVGTAKSTETEKEITLGSGSINVNRPSGKTVIFLAGDSTVKDYSAGAINNSGANRPEGAWGEFLGYFLNDNYEVMDYAEGGRSSRTFIDGTKADGSDRFLDKIKEQMVAGDYLFIQFGHNDSSASYADRYVPVGTPDENGVFPYTAPTSDSAGDGSFKWYLQQYVDAANAVGATPVLVTPVSRRYYNADGTIRSHHGDNDEYVTATKQVAEENGVLCFDLYEWTKGMYEDAYKVDGANGESDLAVRLFAAGEKTHHSKLGGFAIAADFAEMLQNSTIGFADAIVAPKTMYITDNNNDTEFIINNSGVFTGYGRNAENAFDTSVSCEYWTDYINGTLSRIAAYVPDKTETSTETSTETTTVDVPVVDDAIAVVPEVVAQDDASVTVAYKVTGNATGFNNYTLYLTFDADKLSPIAAADGDMSIDVIDAVGGDAKAYASNASNIQVQFTDVPAATNKDFPGADGVKTQAELGKIKISFCIFDKDFASAANGSLPEFTGEGTLFTVTYAVKGDVAGTSIGTSVGVINSVSSDLNVASTPSKVEGGTYTFPGEPATESTTESTTSAPVTEGSTEGTTSAPVTEAPTEDTTSAPVTEASTEGTTSAPVIEAPTEITTQKVTTSSPSRPGSGAGASILKVEGYTPKTTEADTEDVTESSNNTGNVEELPYIKVVVDSKDIIINDETFAMDVAPYIQASSNSTMVPLRFVAIAIAGGDVEKADTSDLVTWDAETKTATIKKGNITAVFTAGSNIVNINGVEAPMNYGVVAEIKDSRMFVPFRAIGEALGAKVDWDADEKAAFYNKK